MHRCTMAFLPRTFGALLSCVLLLGSCEMLGGSSDQNNALQAGGTSDQGNAVQARLVDRFGVPLANASLEVLPEGWTSSKWPDSSLPYASRIVTDSLGVANLRLPAGRYAFHGRFQHLSSIFSIRVDSNRHLELALRAASDVVGILATTGVDTLYVPGTRLHAVIGDDGSFRIDSLPEGSNALTTSDGRILRLDTAGSGFVREYHTSLPLGNSTLPVPDTLIPKYYFTIATPLPLEATRPTTTLANWVPDSVRASGDTIWIDALVRSCDALDGEGISSWWAAESLLVFRRPCPLPEGEPVRHRFFQTPRRGIWTVGTLQPYGYDWEMP